MCASVVNNSARLFTGGTDVQCHLISTMNANVVHRDVYGNKQRNLLDKGLKGTLYKLRRGYSHRQDYSDNGNQSISTKMMRLEVPVTYFVKNNK